MIIVLGGSGDIGSAVVKSFRALGHDVLAPLSSDVDLSIANDVRTFFDSIQSVYGLVFSAFIDGRRGESAKAFRANEAMSANVAKFSHPRWMVFTSSIAVYGRQPRIPLRERTPLDLSGLYARAKVNAERRFTRAASGNYPCLVARLPGVFGGHGSRNQALDRILKQGFKVGEISLGPNGRSRRDWISAWEVAEFIAHYEASPKTGVINLVRGESIAIDDYVDIALGESARIRHIRSPSEVQPQALDLDFDATRLRADFPMWSFARRERDLRRLAVELEEDAGRGASQ
jgi:nucleoside-diphosphate-sugar epimerase